MIAEPVSLIVDYPDGYYTNLPEHVRVAYKHIGKLLLMDTGLLMNNPEIHRYHMAGNTAAINKIIDKHVEILLDTIEDIVVANVVSYRDATSRGIVTEYEIHKVLKDNIPLRETLERDACCFIQSVIHTILCDSRISNLAEDYSSVVVTQVYDHMRVQFQ